MKLHAQIFGKGIPFIILHGFLGMGDNWRTLGKKFSKMGYRVHLVDQRNHGRSPHSDTFGYAAMADDLYEYCNTHGIQKMVLMGHSMGGKTAMTFATQYPDMISKLIVVDIGPQAYPQHHQDILKALNALDFSKITERDEADAVLGRYISEVGVRQFLLKNLYWKEKGKLGLRINLSVLTKTYDEIGNALSQNAEYQGPTLFIKGERSGYINEIDLLTIQKHFPNATMETVPNAGHWVHAENPTGFYEIVKNFL